MLDSSLLETLSRFDTNELERFHKFVYSPFFNEGSYARDVIVLWEYLRPFAPDFSAPGPNTEAAYAFIYPEKKFVNGKVEVLELDLHNPDMAVYAQMRAIDNCIEVEWRDE